MRELRVAWLGRVEYDDGLSMQRSLAAARAAGSAPDTLLLLEHPRVITLGRGAKAGHVLWPPGLLAERGFEVHETDRGGDVTYHGPGQLVGYPILDLKPDRRDVRRYVRSIEEIMMWLAAGFGVQAGRVEGRTGVWVPGAGKLGAIGVHLARWITTHGFAFNVRPDLRDFEAIVPCGLRDAEATSLEKLLGGRAPSLAECARQAAAHAASVWESEAVDAPVEVETVSVAVVREPGEVLVLERIPERGGFWQIVTGRREPGEAAPAAAVRELFEETGFAAEVRDLGYVHSFLLGDSFARETAFAARGPAGSAPRIDPREHARYQWVPLDEALRRLPFAGLRRAARLALQQPT